MQFTKILLFIFAALVSSAAALPSPDKTGDTNIKSKESCGDQNLVFQCCDSATGVGSGILSGLTFLNCNNIGAIGILPVLTSQGQCSGSYACCSGDTEQHAQNGLINVNTGCIAMGGVLD
ncbi:hypothetical protein C7212DRAFT_342524 [Tuber magnatum]|uniref:Hydrophobin n=1 Tax=Tuber magnatum TaxID=42249 RepID=A0A317SVR4_9PEZI|nr:hypothetical protein C7212DRAFT_342524 [Tuber magnatum]